VRERRNLPLTALVASRNEGHLLGACLDAIAFCDELVVVDLESSDDTARIAAEHGARVVRHAVVEVVEIARADVAPTARHDWLLIADPDERMPEALAEELARLLPTLPDDVAIVDAPLQYVFAGRRLRGTTWGGENRRRLLVRRSGVELRPLIWSGMRVLDGFRIVALPFTPETAIEHRWADGYRQLLAKHRRYLAAERVHRADAGEITGLRAIARTPWRSLHESFVTRHGYRDGATGLALSLFWAWFRTAGEVGLYRELRRRR
jgi:glycosyltransferase involved in cell wall biosynthesis